MGKPDGDAPEFIQIRNTQFLHEAFAFVGSSELRFPNQHCNFGDWFFRGNQPQHGAFSHRETVQWHVIDGLIRLQSSGCRGVENMASERSAQCLVQFR